MRVLIVYENAYGRDDTRLTIRSHLTALERLGDAHEVVFYNVRDLAEAWSRLDSKPGKCPVSLRGSQFDAVILHYTFLGYCTMGTSFCLWKRKFAWIGEMSCLKIAIPQDEGDFAAVLDEWLLELGVSAILSVHYAPEGPLYPLTRERAVIENCLPGYIDDEVATRLCANVVPIEQRTKDLVYRARRLSHRFGQAGRMKYIVGDVVATRARELGFNVDISTNAGDAIYGDAWLDFLASGKAVVGSPGGYSAIDRRGELRAQTETILRDDPQISFEDFDQKMPTGWDDARLLTITPRHFEAIMTKTCQVLVEGDYKGVLQSEQHYVPLKADFSNLDEVLDRVRDHGYLQAIADATYDDICRSGRYSYSSFVRQIDGILTNLCEPTSLVVRPMSDRDTASKAIAVLERELIAARDENLLIQSRMSEFSDDIAQRAANMVMDQRSILFKQRLKRWIIVASVVFVVVSSVVVGVLWYLFG